MPPGTHAEIVKELIKTIWLGEGAVLSTPNSIRICGHRVVHGGEHFTKPVHITEDVKKVIRTLCSLAPLHNPSNLEGIEILEELLPTSPQIALFDTSFHRTMPEAVQTYAIPLEWRQKGIRRYGFHGISHAYGSKRTAELLGKKNTSVNLISCHLGNGSSLTAIRGGQSLATTMGFTPMEGLMMGTRSGSIDPGILLHLLKSKRFSVEELDRWLNHASGLKGICGSSDMRELIALKKRGNKEAHLAFEMYIFQLCWYMGALMTTLREIDALIFMGGIGENASEIRQAACERLFSWGIEIDEELNKREGADRRISIPGSRIPIWIIHTREELEIARACLEYTH